MFSLTLTSEGQQQTPLSQHLPFSLHCFSTLFFASVSGPTCFPLQVESHPLLNKPKVLVTRTLRCIIHPSGGEGSAVTTLPAASASLSIAQSDCDIRCASSLLPQLLISALQPDAHKVSLHSATTVCSSFSSAAESSATDSPPPSSASLLLAYQDRTAHSFGSRI